MKYSELLRKLQRAGWVMKRQKGSHIILEKGGQRLIFPMHGAKEVPHGLTQSILKQAKLK